MKLGEKQELFMRLLPGLLNKAFELGFEIRGGDLFRDPRYHGHVGERGAGWILTLLKLAGTDPPKEMYGHRKSAHKNKLAIDLNLRVRDGGMIWSTEGHRELGEWWEKQHELCRWGGRFNDGNHYSLEHNGVM